MNVPVYVKRSDDDPWPVDPMFYLVTRSGMFVCRWHPWFVSAARIRVWPPELAAQREFLEAAFPVVPQVLLERVVGFFRRVAHEHACEAGVYLVAERDSRAVDVRVPRQVATVREARSGVVPIGLVYEAPPELGPHEAVLGTIHSHAFDAAYASGVDVDDEVDKPGIHLVVGRLDRDPPEFSVEAVVDGARFRMELGDVVEGFAAPRDDFPDEWLARVEVEVLTPWSAR